MAFNRFVKFFGSIFSSGNTADISSTSNRSSSRKSEFKVSYISNYVCQFCASNHQSIEAAGKDAELSHSCIAHGIHPDRSQEAGVLIEPNRKVKEAVEAIEAHMRLSQVTPRPGTVIKTMPASSSNDDKSSAGGSSTKDFHQDGDVAMRATLTRPRYKSQLMTDVPFYQDYSENAVNRDVAVILQATHARRRTFDALEDLPEGLSESMESIEKEEAAASNPVEKASTTHQEDSLEAVTEDGSKDRLMVLPGILANSGPGGVRWAEMEQVMSSGKLNIMTAAEIKRQEALFEIITSEASYYRSLTVLVEGYLNAEQFKRKLLLANDIKNLFSNISDIYETSEKFLFALESRWLESPVISDLSDIVRDFAHDHFKCFITYVGNQHYQFKKLNDLKKNKEFFEALKQHQAKSQCPALSLDSFLLLPMQRICRLQLLMRTVLKCTPVDTLEHCNALIASGALEKVLSDCDSTKKLIYHRQRILEWTMKITFNRNLKSISLGDQTRHLLKIGSLFIVNASHPSQAFKKPFIRRHSPEITVILLNDYMLLARAKKSHSEEDVKYVIEETIARSSIRSHCGSSLWTKSAGSLEQLAAHSNKSSNNNNNEPLPTTSDLNQFHIHLKVEDLQYQFVFQANSFNDMERWIDAFNAPCHHDDTFDSPNLKGKKQAIVKRSYLANEDDELDLKDGERIIILKECYDGWSQGITRDNHRGWFPSSHVTAVFGVIEGGSQQDMVVAKNAYNEWIVNTFQQLTSSGT